MTTGRTPAARKSLGQHFLVDRSVLRRIVEAADLSCGDTVVEIGPGRGVLTRELARRAGRVVAVEIDRGLVDVLEDRLSESPGVEVVWADARTVDLESLVPLDAPYKVVANLPYYSASPIVRRFLGAAHKPSLMVVMVQREVAQSMAAAPGRMGLMSVAVQLYGRPRIVCSVPPRSFRPAPRVTSAVVRIDVLPAPAVELDSEERFFTLVRAAFSAPRKQLRNSLSHGLSVEPAVAEGMLAEARIDHRRRSATVSLEEWGSLYAAFRRLLPAGVCAADRAARPC